MRWRKGRGDQAGDDASERRAEESASSADPAEAPSAGDATPSSGEATTLDPWAEDDVPPGAATPAAAAAPPGERVEVELDLADIAPEELERATRRSVARALAEDLGDRGDVTSLVTVPAGTAGSARFVARAAGVVAGVDVVRAVYEQVDARVAVAFDVADGDRVDEGQVLGSVTGPLRSILTGERTALNFLCHLSGVATRTAAFVHAVEGTGCAIRDTRKTTPGLRLLEKAAVRAAGGHSHRMGLHDAILVKDNHIASAGSLARAVEGALARDDVHVQVEVTSLDQLEEAVRLGVTDILLDNFTPDQVRQAVQRTGGRAALEASGTISLDTVARYAATGVGRVAVGAITHSAPNLDVALDVAAEETEAPVQLASVWSDDEVGGDSWLRGPDGIADADEAPAPDVEPGTDDPADADEPPAPDLGSTTDDDSTDTGDEELAGDEEVTGELPSDDELEGPSASPAFVDAETDDVDAASDSGLFAWRERQLGDDATGQG